MKLYNERDYTPTTNEWKEAVLDECAIACLDFPINTPPREIIRKVIEMNVFFATDPKLNPAKQVAKETLSQTLSRLSIELKSIKQGISKL